MSKWTEENEWDGMTRNLGNGVDLEVFHDGDGWYWEATVSMAKRGPCATRKAAKKAAKRAGKKLLAAVLEAEQEATDCVLPTIETSRGFFGVAIGPVGCGELVHVVGGG